MKSTATTYDKTYSETLVNIKIIICSNIQITPLSSTTKVYTFDSTQPSPAIDQATISAFYFSSSDILCTSTKNDLYSDTAGSTLFSHSSITYSTGPQKIQISTTSSFQFVTFYLHRATTSNQPFQSYITFKIEVCGLETITRTQTTILTYILNKNPGNFHILDTITTSPWFQLNLITTDSQCFINFHQLYEDNTMSTLWNDPLILFDLGSSATSTNNYPIKIDLNNGFALKSVYYFARSRGQVKQYYQLNIEVCGDETVTTDGQIYTLVLYQIAGSTHIIPATTANSWFTQSNTGVNCHIIDYALFKDNSGTTTWTEPEVQQDRAAPAVSYGYPINVNQNQAYVSNQFYLRAITKGGVKSYKELFIAVCGIVTVKDPAVINYSFDYDMTPQWQIKDDIYTMFNGAAALCPFQQQWIYRDDIGNHDNTTVKISLNNELQFNTKQGSDPMEWQIRVIDLGGNLVIKKFFLLICGSEQIIVEPGYEKVQVYSFKYQDTYQGNQEQRIPNIDKWMKSSLSQCPVTSWKILDSQGAPYVYESNSWEIAIDDINKEIIVSTKNNLHLEVKLQALSNAKVSNTVNLKIDVCGQENITKLSDEDKVSRFDLDQGDGLMAIVQGNQWFQSSDSQCPIVSFSLESKQNEDTYYKYSGNSIKMIGDTLTVITSFPFGEDVYLKASTERGVISRQKYRIRICGDEKINVDPKQRIINYNDVTELEILYEDIQLPFKSDDELCPVTSYSISEKSNETDIFSLMDNKVAMYDKPIGSGNYTIIFDFPKMYEDFEEEKVKIFYIVAATKSKVVKAQEVFLMRQGCEAQYVSADQTKYVKYEYDENSTFTIPQRSYIQYFTSSDPKRCPITYYRLAFTNGATEVYTKLHSYAKIDIKFEIILDFRFLIKENKPSIPIWICGITDAYRIGYMPIWLIHKKKKENLAFVNTFANQLNNFNSTEELEKLNKKREEKAIQKLKIEEEIKANITLGVVNFKGLLEIKFSQPMFDESQGLNLSIIESNRISFEAESVYNYEKFKFNWTVVSFKNQKLIIQFNFKNPLKISENLNEIQQRDKLNMRVLDKEIFKFKTKNGWKTFKKDQLVKQTDISKQLKNDGASRMLLSQSENLQSTMNWIMISQLILNVFMSGSMSALTGTLHVLQVICFQTMMNLKYPGNAQFIANILISFLNADVLDPEIVTDAVFSFDEDSKIIKTVEETEKFREYDIISQVKEMGFETYNPILNLGGVFMVIVFIFLQFITMLILKLIVNKLKKLRSLHKDEQNEGGEDDLKTLKMKIEQEAKQKKKEKCVKRALKKIGRYERELRYSLQYSGPLIVIYESIIQLMMAFLLYVIEPRFIKFKDVSSMWTKICSFVFGCLSLISIIILFVISLRLIYLDKSVLENPLIIRKFGVLYDNLKTSKRIYLVYVSLFIYRRSFMAIIYLFLSGSNHWQILYTIYQNFALSMFVGFNKPFKIKSDYFREYVNEWFIMTLTFNLILFSDFILDQEFKYDVAGWGYVYMIGICVAFNLTYLIKAMFNQIRLIVVKYFKRLRYWFVKKYPPKPKPIKNEIEEKSKNFDSVSTMKITENQIFDIEEQNLLAKQLTSIKSKSMLNPQIKTQKQNLVNELKQMEDLTVSRLKDNFKRQRKVAFRDCAVNFIKDTFVIDKIDDLLYNQEIIMMYHNYRLMRFFRAQFSKFLNNQLIINNNDPSKVSFDSVENFYRKMNIQINKSYIERITIFLHSDKLVPRSSFENFSQFAMKTINRVYLKNELLNKKGEIRRENLDKEPCKYEFFRVEYSDKFMVQEEIKMMIITQDEFQMAMPIGDDSWNLNTFSRMAHLESSDRLQKFQNRIMNTYDDPEMIVKAQNYIKTFYDIMKHFLDIRTKELFTSKSILKKRMQKMMKKDPYDKLSFDIMELIKRIQLKDQVITIIKRTIF